MISSSFSILRLKGKPATRNFVVPIAETNLTGSITNFLFGSSADVVMHLGKRCTLNSLRRAFRRSQRKIYCRATSRIVINRVR